MNPQTLYSSLMGIALSPVAVVVVTWGVIDPLARVVNALYGHPEGNGYSVDAFNCDRLRMDAE